MCVIYEIHQIIFKLRVKNSILKNGKAKIMHFIFEKAILGIYAICLIGAIYLMLRIRDKRIMWVVVFVYGMPWLSLLIIHYIFPFVIQYNAVDHFFELIFGDVKKLYTTYFLIYMRWLEDMAKNVAVLYLLYIYYQNKIPKSG